MNKNNILYSFQYINSHKRNFTKNIFISQKIFVSGDIF
ncbi:hypothetical protein DJ66_0594 [Candidatus Liberibacter solanacearum]|uniref:Uncharacterized protein n=1 Tax=Candidatus Liberibacter solanacearum TaxID=556287 RepID=A0A0F4VK62_9HYPH|nr:hypothetical protein DJ66_0594 [Candidatus Liberibacter solanacearum]